MGNAWQAETAVVVAVEAAVVARTSIHGRIRHKTLAYILRVSISFCIVRSPESDKSVESAPVPGTPSGQRTRMSNFYTNRAPNAVGGDGYHQPTPQRSAFNNMDPNIYGHADHSYGGMSAGVKVPRQQAGPINRNGVGMGRPGGVGGLNIR